MAELVRIGWQKAQGRAEDLVEREWLVTNGLGGYASGTLAGVCTRRYHGLLVAALPAPLGRMMMLNHLSERVTLPDGSSERLSGEERTVGLEMHGAAHLKQFQLEQGLPVWLYEFRGVIIEKRVLLPHFQNTVHIHYRMLEGPAAVRLKLRPALHMRGHDASVNTPSPRYSLLSVEDRHEILAGNDLPTLRLKLYGERSALTIENQYLREVVYRTEGARGYNAQGDLWSPGYFRVTLARESPVTLVASTEAWDTLLSLPPAEALSAELERRQQLLAAAPPKARREVSAELVLAADQFIIMPAGRVEDATRARAEGDEPRTVIAGYHWFTDWGRDTMISLEGLTLATGRRAEAAYILRTFAYHIRNGLIPNMFPEGNSQGLYHTADATLWMFQALNRYLAQSQDRLTLERLLPRMQEVVEHHVRGTLFGIGVDARDGLLRQGAEGYQLTWMDAKLDEWVVTPRRGKAVEINALWYNALCILAGFQREIRGAQAARPLLEQAEHVQHSFNRRFWYEKGGYLYDVVDGESGDDPACRPNQLFAISLANPVLVKERWAAVLDTVKTRLLTPYGLRSLAPDDADYKATYRGDLRTRDAAYHQGTVWSYLIGPFIDAFLRVYPGEQAAARRYLDALAQHLGEACIGSISEVFDAETPFAPGGCAAQAWGVAELLRAWLLTEEA